MWFNLQQLKCKLIYASAWDRPICRQTMAHKKSPASSSTPKHYLWKFWKHSTTRSQLFAMFLRCSCCKRGKGGFGSVLRSQKGGPALCELVVLWSPFVLKSFHKRTVVKWDIEVFWEGKKMEKSQQVFVKPVWGQNLWRNQRQWPASMTSTGPQRPISTRQSSDLAPGAAQLPAVLLENILCSTSVLYILLQSIHLVMFYIYTLLLHCYCALVTPSFLVSKLYINYVTCILRP